MELFGLSAVQIWIIIGIILIIVEFTTLTFFLLWPGVAALVLALITWILPGISYPAQWVIFAVISLALLIPGRKYIRKYLRNKDNGSLNAKMDGLIGKSAKIVYLDGTTIRAKLGDTEWSARSNSPLKKGDLATVIATDGNILILE